VKVAQPLGQVGDLLNEIKRKRVGSQMWRGFVDGAGGGS